MSATVGYRSSTVVAVKFPGVDMRVYTSAAGKPGRAGMGIETGMIASRESSARSNTSYTPSRAVRAIEGYNGTLRVWNKAASRMCLAWASISEEQKTEGGFEWNNVFFLFESDRGISEVLRCFRFCLYKTENWCLEITKLSHR